MKHIHTFESFLNESFLFEAVYPVPHTWETITPARYKEEIDFMKWLRAHSSQKEEATAKKAEMGYVYIWDYSGWDDKTSTTKIPLVDGTRPPIVDTTQDDSFPIISKKTISSVKALEVIGVPIKLNGFEVAQHDLPVEMNWWEAEYSCVELDAGWYLPDKKQMQEMIKAADELGLVKGKWYWGAGNPRQNNGFLQFTTSGTIDTIDGQGAGQWKCFCRPIKK